jgi:hypothetical protein
MITSNRNTRKRVVARDHQHEAPFVDAIPTTRYLGVRLANNALVVDCKEHIAMLKLSLPVGRNKRRKGVVASDERAVQRRRAIDPPAASNLHHSRPGSHSRQVNSDKGVVLNAACGGWTDRHRERVCVCSVCAWLLEGVSGSSSQRTFDGKSKLSVFSENDDVACYKFL